MKYVRSVSLRANLHELKIASLGTSGFKVSKVILGAMSFGSPKWSSGWVLGPEDSYPVLKAAWDAGITTWDSELTQKLLAIRLQRTDISSCKHVFEWRIGEDRGPDAQEIQHPEKPGPNLDKSVFSMVSDNTAISGQHPASILAALQKWSLQKHTRLTTTVLLAAKTKSAYSMAIPKSSPNVSTSIDRD